MGDAAMERECKAVSLVGSKIEYLASKFATTTTTILVLDYDRIAKENMVKELGKSLSRRDVVKLLKEYPSAHVSTCPPDDPIFVEYTVEEAAKPKGTSRKSKTDAYAKMKRLAEPEEDISDDGPPPRRPRVFRQNHVSCTICLSEDANFVSFNPCGHAPFCVACAARAVAHNGGHCPICREVTTGTQRLFFA